MILYELLNTEDNAAYQDLSIDNLERQYDFVRSLVTAALAVQRPMLSTAIITALNAHAIACLHVNAGQFRPCPVYVGEYEPPPHYRVPELMNIFVNDVNYSWQQTDAVVLAAYVLWKINHIHPFINGNGRTARALCYYVICTKLGGMLDGDPILPELIRQNRQEYVDLLKEADRKYSEQDQNYLVRLHEFIAKLLDQQVRSVRDYESPT